MPKVIVSLAISEKEILKYYKGSAKFILAQTQQGQTVRFPINVVRQFVTTDGIQGRFAISYSKEGKFESIEKLML